MTWDTDSVSSEGILDALRSARMLPSDAPARIEPFPRNFGRRDAHSKLAFRVWSGDESAFHLTVGRSLSSLRAKAEAFAQAVPEIACKPLFFLSVPGFDLFGQEFFGETNIEEGLARRLLDPDAWSEAVSCVKARLEATATPSSPSLLFEELDLLQKGVLDSEGFADADRTFLNEAVFPIIRHGASLVAPRKTWTNGDFIARNILFDVRGGYRLVDTEFAGLTHFGELDWLRLELFSHVPGSAKLRLASGGQDTPRWWEMLCWLQHALRLSEIFLPEVVEENLPLIAGKLVRLVKAEGSLPRMSIFQRAVATEEGAHPSGQADVSKRNLTLEWSRSGSLASSTTATLPVKDGVLGELEFELKAGSAKRLLGRMVLPTVPASIEIRRIGLRSNLDNALLWGAEGPELAAQLHAEGNACPLPFGDGARFLSLGGRSAVVLPQVDLSGHREGLTLSLWLSLGFSAEHFAPQAPAGAGPDAASDRGPATAQLLFPGAANDGSPYSDARSQYAAIERAGAWNEVSFPTPGLPAGSVLRFDPSDRPGFFEISRISLELQSDDPAGGGEIDLLSIQGLSANGDCSALTSAVPFRFIAFGDDPSLLLPPLPAAAADRPGRLIATYRFTAQAPAEAWSSELRRQRQAYFEAVGRENALREELIRQEERHRHEAALAAKEAQARLDALEVRTAEQIHEIQESANRTIEEAYKAAAEGHRVATESNRAAEAAKLAAAESIRAASLAGAESVRAAYEAAAEAHRVATESNHAADAAREAADLAVRNANDAAAKRIQEAEEAADRKCRAIREAADRTIHEAYAAAAEAHRVATDSNHAAEAARQAAAHRIAGLESTLADLGVKLDGATESLYAQNDRLLDYAHRAGLAAIEFKNLENSLADAVRIEAALRADLNRVSREAGEVRAALESKSAEFLNAQTQAAALRQELSEFRGRLLVRMDSAFRRKKPAQHSK